MLNYTTEVYFFNDEETSARAIELAKKCNVSIEFTNLMPTGGIKVDGEKSNVYRFLATLDYEGYERYA